MSNQRWPKTILEENGCITLAYARLVGLNTLDQHRTIRWQLRRTEEQNNIEPLSFIIVGQQNVYVNQTNDCFVGIHIPN